MKKVSKPKRQILTVFFEGKWRTIEGVSKPKRQILTCKALFFFKAHCVSKPKRQILTRFYGERNERLDRFQSLKGKF